MPQDKTRLADFSVGLADCPSECMGSYLWQGLPYPVSLVDREERLIQCNDAFLRRVHEAPFGRSLFELPGFAALRPQFERVFFHGEAASVSELDFGLAPDAHWRASLLHHLPIMDSHGDPRWIVTLWHEMLPPTRGQESLTSILGHELRTPLNFITGFASLLEEEVAGPINGEQQRYVEKILEGSARMTRLIEKLVDQDPVDDPFRIHPLSLEPADVCRLCESVVEDFQAAAVEKELDLTFDSFHPLPAIRLDPERVRQALSHLVENAIKFTPPRGSIELLLEEIEGGLSFLVQDSGCGVPPESLHRIFEPFYQVDMTTRRAVGGAGLGLSVVAHIVSAHEGRLGVESVSGNGATFWFTLPAV